MSLSSSLWPGKHGEGEGDESPTLSGWKAENEERVSTLSGWTTETEGRASQGGDEDESSPFSGRTTEKPERHDETATLSGWGEAVAEARHPPDAGLADLHPFAVDALGGRVRGIVF